jgi:putative tricarboxylic transport membrane protein
VFSGTYSINNSLFDLGLVLASGVLGFGMRYFGLPLLPTVLGLVLGYMIESNYRRSLVISGGDLRVFVEDPISATFLVLAVVFLAGSLYSEYRRRRTAEQGAAP